MQKPKRGIRNSTSKAAFDGVAQPTEGSQAELMPVEQVRILEEEASRLATQTIFERYGQFRHLPTNRKKRASSIGQTAVKEELVPAQIAEVYSRAVHVIGDTDKAMRWLGRPIPALDYATPISLLKNAKGRDAALLVLGRLEHGVF